MDFQEWFDLYLSTYKRDIKPRTREEYQRQHRIYIAPIIGAKPLEAVSPEDCQEIINAAAVKGERIAQAVFALLSGVPSGRAGFSGHQWTQSIDPVTSPSRGTP